MQTCPFSSLALFQINWIGYKLKRKGILGSVSGHFSTVIMMILKCQLGCQCLVFVSNGGEAKLKVAKSVFNGHDQSSELAAKKHCGCILIHI